MVVVDADDDVVVAAAVADTPRLNVVVVPHDGRVAFFIHSEEHFGLV